MKIPIGSIVRWNESVYKSSTRSVRLEGVCIAEYPRFYLIELPFGRVRTLHKYTEFRVEMVRSA